jgi:hypothetical protein
MTMASKENVRRSKIRVGLITTTTEWRNPYVTISCYMGGRDRHEVVLQIQDPWEVRALQAELQKIMDYWKSQL